MGRRPNGPELVEGANGSEESKRKLKGILEALVGEKGVAEAAAELGIGEAMFHRLKTRVIQGALDSLQPRKVGRPRQGAHEESERVSELEAEVKRLERELKLAEAREQIGIAMPYLAKRAKKKRHDGT